MSEIKKSAKHGNFIIEQLENKSISVKCNNTIQVLRDIANEVGMEYKSDWNTQSFGRRLIDFINDVDTTRKSKNSEESDTDDDKYDVSDKDWAWWQNLSDVLKYILLYSFKEIFEAEGVAFPEWNGDWFEEGDFNLDDRDSDTITSAGWWLKNYIVGGYNKDGEFAGVDDFIVTVPTDAYAFVSVEQLAHLEFMYILDLGEWECGSIPDDLGKLTQLVELNLSDNYVNTPKEVVAQICQLKTLEKLWIENTGLDEDDELMSQLIDALPDCDIIADSHPLYKCILSNEFRRY